MSSNPGLQTNSGNLIGVGFRLEILNLFASIVLHPLNWYAPRLSYTKFSWCLTVGPFTLTQVDYGKYSKMLLEQEKSAAKELVKILEQLESVNDSAKDKLKDLTKVDHDSHKAHKDKTK
jgi:hypothetical protein